MKRLITGAIFTASLLMCCASAAFAAEGDYIVMLNEDAVSLFGEGAERIGERTYLVSEEEALEAEGSGAARLAFPDEVLETDGCVFEEQSEGASLYAESAESFPDAANDTYFSSQWNLRAINAPAAWRRGLRGNGVTVAVLDSGLNISHLDIKDKNITRAINLVEGEDENDVTDINGHGTFVTGIIASSANNMFATAGIADEVNLMPIKIANEGSFLSSCLLKGMYTAISSGCDVINISLSFKLNEGDTEETSQTLQALRVYIEEAREKNIILVSTAGNGGGTDTAGDYHYPASLDGVMSVGSVGRYYGENEEERVERMSLSLKSGEAYTDVAAAPYEPSSFTQHNDRVFCAAPGWMIYGPGISSNQSVVRSSGTSFAAAHISAVAAAAKQLYPQITQDELEEAIIASAKDAYTEGYDEYTGYGVPDMGRLMSYLDEKLRPQNLGAEFTVDAYGKISAEAYFDPIETDVDFYAAVYEDGRLVGAKAVTALAGSASVRIDTDMHGDEAAVFVWTNGAMVPLSPKMSEPIADSAE